MLSHDDAELAAADPALPGLATVLDDERMAAVLAQALPSPGVAGAHRTYARYKPGRSCVVAYRLATASGALDAYARAHPRERFAGLALKQHRTGRADGGPILVAEGCLSLHPFPHDRRLEALPVLADARRRRDLFRVILADAGGFESGRLQTLRYWPERRFTALIASADVRAVVKAYEPSLYPRARRNAAAFSSRGPLRLARLLGSDDTHRLLAFEWLPGTCLGEQLGAEGRYLVAVRAAGAALAELHAQPAAGLSPLDLDAEGEFLLSRARWIGAIRADLLQRAVSLAGRLAGELSRTGGDERPLHGDFSLEQVLASPDGVSIIDLDDAVLGEVAVDVAGFAAKLEMRALAGTLEDERVDAVVEALVEGYESQTARRIDRVRLRRWTAAQLLRRAASPFRHGHRGWRRLLERLVERAERLAD